MRTPRANNWRSWRLTRPAAAASAPLRAVARAAPAAVPLDEVPGPDGIRWALVARVRLAIAAGTYDTPEAFALAEEKLFRRLEADE
jgi:hypothetical protein